MRNVVSLSIAWLVLGGPAFPQAEKHRIGPGDSTFSPGYSVGLPPGQRYGQIGQVHGLRLDAIGAADVYGHGPYDLFLGVTGLFPFAGFDEAGTPRYGRRIELPEDRRQRIDCIITGPDGTIFGLSPDGKQVHVATFDRSSLQFTRIGTSPRLDLPRGMSGGLGAWLDPQQRLHVYFAVGDGAPLRHDDNHHAATFLPYDGGGFWRGNIPRLSLYHARFDSIRMESLEELTRASDGPGEFLFSIGNMAVLDLGDDRPPGLAAVDKQSTVRYFPLDPDSGRPGAMHFISTPQALALRHPVIGPSIRAVPDPETGRSNLILCDTCRAWYYRSTGEWTADGNPIFAGPTPLEAEGVHLSLGSLPCISAGDMDRDGLVDLMVGNDAGLLLFVRNVGSAKAAAVGAPVAPLVGGVPLDIKAGYAGSVQGPQEAMWGYTCPTVYDWNGDCLPDVILNSITANYLVLLQEPSDDGIRFAAPRLLYCDGLQLHLAWRSQPGITDWRLGGRTCMIALDEGNVLRRFWRMDDENLVRGDLLRFQDGTAITANVDEFAGQTGRGKIVPYDYDGDGTIDLMIGASRGLSWAASPTTFYPSSFGETRAASLLFLRNAGTNERPVFEYARLLQFEGERIQLGIHCTSPAFVDIGRGVEDLLVGEELGSIKYYPRESLSLSPKEQ